VHFFTPIFTKIVCRLGLPQTPWGELTALPSPLAVFRGATSKGRGERGGEMKREEGRGEERRGGMEFTLCPKKKKVGAYAEDSHNLAQRSTTEDVLVPQSLSA